MAVSRRCAASIALMISALYGCKWAPAPRHLANIDPLNRIPDIKVGIPVEELLHRRPEVIPSPMNAYKERIGADVFVYKVDEAF